MQEKSLPSSLNIQIPDQRISRSYRRREIRVGHRVVIGSVCSLCPPWTSVVIYPDASMETHIARHGLTPEERDPQYGHRSGRQGGREPGAKNKHSMSASGIEKKNGGIRKPR